MVGPMTQDESKMYYHPESKRLAQIYKDFLNLGPFPRLGHDIEGFLETDETVAGFSSRRWGWSDDLCPDEFPLITKELEAAVRQAVSNSQNKADADYLWMHFERMKELEAQLYKCVQAERESRERNDNAAK